jgi:hypothetical protein
MRFTHICVLIFTLVATLPSFGQKYLQKPYTEWSKEETQKVLTDFPWANEYQSERGLDVNAKLRQAREQADTRLSGSERGNQGAQGVPPPIVVRLFSAMPVRQAFVRLQQFEVGYDKMNADDKAKFDASKASFLECKICKDYYVVTLTKYKDSSTSVNNGIFQTLKLADVKGKIWLENDKGQRRELTEFTPPKGEADKATLFFKRTDDAGTPFFTASDKLIKIMFSNDLRDDTSEYSLLIPRLFEFKVAKMVVDGQLIF